VKNRGQWSAGQSGNPGGRKRGTGKIEPLRAQIREAVPEIVAAMVERAKGGDVGAARLLLERSIPALKPAAEPVAVPLSGETLTDKAAAVVEAVAGGQLAPSDGKLILDGLAAVAKIAEVDELKRRIEALEAAHGAA
jgi:hypothetical protein